MKHKKVIVKSQKSLDSISEDFEGVICINFGNYMNPALVTKKYKEEVIVYGKSCAKIYNNSVAIAYDSSEVIALDYSQVYGYDNSHIYAHDNSQARVRIRSIVTACDDSEIIASNSCQIIACDNSKIEAYDDVQMIEEKNYFGDIILFQNARIIKEPNTNKEFMDYYGIKYTKEKSILYIPTKKSKSKTYTISDYYSYTYKVDACKKIVCTFSKDKETNPKIRLYNLNNALYFGENWKDLVILEVESKIQDLEIPKFRHETDIKIDINKIKIIREVPIEECGLIGKFILRRNSES